MFDASWLPRRCCLGSAANASAGADPSVTISYQISKIKPAKMETTRPDLHVNDKCNISLYTIPVQPFAHKGDDHPGTAHVEARNDGRSKLSLCVAPLQRGSGCNCVLGNFSKWCCDRHISVWCVMLLVALDNWIANVRKWTSRVRLPGCYICLEKKTWTLISCSRFKYCQTLTERMINSA